MLVIIIPVMVLTVAFAWKYRQSNTAARYEPDWDHSTHLELVIWAAPLAIIICLGAITWMGTHLLDPYRPLAVTAKTEASAPLEVEVVALDWKWLFIYPEYGIAAVNELAVPVDRPISFRITSSTVMNSFFIPALAGQIYAMPGMETKLHAILDRTGSFEGFSANYSGAGFSGMRFAFRGLSTPDFDAWVASVKSDGGDLTREAYLGLERPTENEPVRHYASVAPGLYDAVRNMCVDTGKMCLSEMMSIDAKGGLGVAGINNLIPLELTYDKFTRRGAILGPEPAYIAAICTPQGEEMPATRAAAQHLPDGAPLVGAGLGLPRSALSDPQYVMASWSARPDTLSR
jgi:cytochrome o ubiquinol oxidase subunit 2